MSNVTPIRKEMAQIAAELYAAIPAVAPTLNMWGDEADALYNTLSMMPPADRDAAIERIGDPQLVHHYRAWLICQEGA